MIRKYALSCFLLVFLGAAIVGCKDKNDPGPATTTTTTTTTTTSGTSAGSTSGTTSGTTSGSTSGTTSGSTSGTTSGSAFSLLTFDNQQYQLPVTCYTSTNRFILYGLRDSTMRCVVELSGYSPTVTTTYNLVPYTQTLTGGEASLRINPGDPWQHWTSQSGQLTVSIVNGRVTANWSNILLKKDTPGPETKYTSGTLAC